MNTILDINENMNMKNIIPTQMYDAQKRPWESLGGCNLDRASQVSEALELAGLNFIVKQSEQYTRINDVEVPTGMFANYRSDNGLILGSVGKNYQIVQNSEAFDFVNDMLGGTDISLETAGTVSGSRVVWLLAKTPESIILDDKFENYMLFVNSFDGSSSVKVCFTPIRVWCKNTINLALRTCKRTFSFMHTSSINRRIDEVRKIVCNHDSYQQELAKEAEHLVGIKYSKAQVEKFLQELFPIPEEVSNRKLNNLESLRNNFINCYSADDIGNFRGTAWGLINAVSDMAYHSEPQRKSKNMDDKGILSVINGAKLLDRAYTIIGA